MNAFTWSWKHELYVLRKGRKTYLLSMRKETKPMGILMNEEIHVHKEEPKVSEDVKFKRGR